MMRRSLLAVITLVALGVSAVFTNDARAQSIAPGHLWANGTMSSAPPGDTAPSTWFDQAYCSTIGQLIVRTYGAWTCAPGIPANPLWWDNSNVCAGGGDCAAALNAAIAATTNIIFPPGKFKFNSQITVNLPNANVSLTINGSGSANTTLYWPSTSGIVVNYATGVYNSVHFRGLTISTGAAGGTNAGITLAYSGPYDGSAGATVNTFDDVFLRGDDGIEGTDYWNIAILCNAVSSVNFTGVQITGPSAGPGGGYPTVGTGIYLEGNSTTLATVFNITDSIFDFLGQGLIYGPYVQGVTVSQSNFTGDGIGILVPTGESIGKGVTQLSVAHSQFNTGTFGIEEVTPVPATSIVGSLFIQTIAGDTAVDLLGAGLYAEVVGNNFSCTGVAGEYGFVTSGTIGSVTGNIFGYCTIGLDFQTGSSNWIAVGNNFNTNTTAVSNSGTNNVIANNLGWNPVGAAAAANVGTSPATVCAGASPETHYLNQSATNTATVTEGSQQIATLANASTYYPVNLGPNECYVVTWATTQPTYTKYVH